MAVAMAAPTLARSDFSDAELVSILPPHATLNTDPKTILTAEHTLLDNEEDYYFIGTLSSDDSYVLCPIGTNRSESIGTDSRENIDRLEDDHFFEPEEDFSSPLAVTTINDTIAFSPQLTDEDNFCGD